MKAYIARLVPFYFTANISVLAHQKEKKKVQFLKALKVFQFTNAVVPFVALKTFLKFHLKHLFLSQFPFHRTDTESPIFLIFPSQPLPQLLGLWCVKLRSSLEDLGLSTACGNSEFGVHRVLKNLNELPTSESQNMSC